MSYKMTLKILLRNEMDLAPGHARLPAPLRFQKYGLQ